VEADEKGNPVDQRPVRTTRLQRVVGVREESDGFTANTDGNDGPTDAAGRLVTGAMLVEGAAPEEALANNDAYAALKDGEALLATEPIGTNVNDLRVALMSRGSIR
jgi:glycerate-2-kinase